LTPRITFLLVTDKQNTLEKLAKLDIPIEASWQASLCWAVPMVWRAEAGHVGLIGHQSVKPERGRTIASSMLCYLYGSEP
jgi:hypothetical protein